MSLTPFIDQVIDRDRGAEPAPVHRPQAQGQGSGPERSSQPPTPRSIRSSLLRIVFVLVASAIAGLGALAFGFYQSEQKHLSQSIFTTAAALSSALDRDLEGLISAAQIMASSQSLASDDFASFYREASAVVPLLRGHLIAVADGSGRQLINTMRPYGEPLPIAANEAARRKVFETSRPVISDLFVGATSNRQAVAVYVPVTRDGSVKYTLVVGVPPSKLHELLKGQQLPSDWTAAIVDASDIVVAHSSDPMRIGKLGPVPPSSLPSSDHLIETTRTDGTPLYVGFAKSALSGWTVAISVPTAQSSRQPNVLLFYGGAGMFGVLLAGLLVATREATRIAQAMQTLIPAALALGRGERPVIPRSNVHETDEVGRALERAHQLLQKRTSERDWATFTIAERSLADEMFRLAVEACPSGMVMTDSDGKIVMINTEVEHMFGYTRDELVGQSVDVLVPEPLRSKHLCSRTRFTSAPECRRMGEDRDLYGTRKDGSEFPIEVDLNPINTGDQLMVLSVIVDISQRKRTERLKDEFVATVSHELRTPLTSISGSLGLLAGQWANKLPESAARLLTIAHTNSQRLVRLVNDILDIEKMESDRIVFNMDRIVVRSLVESAIEDNRGFAASYGVKVRLDDASVPLDVNADPDRLSQVITNLLSNAIKFSPRGEEVVIGIAKCAPNVRISVHDHGPGVPADFKSHIFEKFAQADATNARKKGGTGLGLSIVKQIVERLGGKAGFEDAPGGGAIFYVDLPEWHSEVGGEIDLDADPAAPRLLFCEDERQIAILVRERLRKEGFAVDFAHSVNAAVTRSEATRYAAIVADLQFPDGDGVGLIMRLRAQAQNRQTPIIVLAGDPEKGRADARSAALKVLHWLPKPIRFTPLIEILKTQVGVAPRHRPRVLHVDDDYHTLAAVAAQLRSVVDVVSADSAEKARRTLSTERIDLVVLDIGLGENSGLDLLPAIRDSAGNLIPVIIFSNRTVVEHWDSHMDCPIDSHGGPQIGSSLSKSDSSLERLTNAVRDRLSLPTTQPTKEVA
jgi:PAS domain S-box-containing protein